MIYKDKRNRRKYNAFCFLLFALLFALWPMRIAFCASASANINRGNNFYRQGRYDEALEYYDKAQGIAPDSGIVNFDKGAALYQKGHYEKAVEAFSKALLGENSGIEEKAAYNIGNSKFRSGKLKADTDLDSAINSYRQALDYYKRALELNRKNADAKYNYDFVEKELKELLKKQQQQKQQSRQQDRDSQHRKDQQKEQSAQGSQGQKQEQGQKQKDQQEEQGQEQQSQGEQERQQGGEQQAPREAEEERQAPKQAKGYPQNQETEDEMSEEEARMILDRYGQESRLLGNMGREEKAKYPAVLKDW